MTTAPWILRPIRPTDDAAMAAVIVRICGEAASREEVCKPRIAGAMFGEAMIDLDDTARFALSSAHIEIKRGAGRRRQ